MEYALRALKSLINGAEGLVLILILMEYALRGKRNAAVMDAVTES